ncbi:DUF5615 family PIN-like protein [Fortiea contorta]|uniref:DUF5615 family PIN-like protein n=1 Tax=Fortiea contorta TaxID=1892405 RepID=UPI0003491AB5|nr:DUF5615 family PIN-like protein [Fortiea contorta]
MSIIRLYIDEDSQDQSLIRGLHARKIDVITVNETQTAGLIDLEQLRLATQQQRVLYSHNIGDFCQIHTEFAMNNEMHSGIALLDQNYSVGCNTIEGGKTHWCQLKAKPIARLRMNSESKRKSHLKMTKNSKKSSVYFSKLWLLALEFIPRWASKPCNKPSMA